MNPNLKLVVGGVVIIAFLVVAVWTKNIWYSVLGIFAGNAIIYGIGVRFK